MTPTKKCSSCKNICFISAFGKSSRNKSGLTAICKECASVQNKKYAEHGRQRAIKAKLDYGKCDCHGIVVTLDNLDEFEWDHIDPKTKKFRISQMQKRSDWQFYEELAKCRLVCPSFHIAHTRQQRLQGLIGTNKSPMSSLVIQKPAHQESLFEGM